MNPIKFVTSYNRFKYKDYFKLDKSLETVNITINNTPKFLEETTTKDRQEKLPKISKKFWIIESLNQLVETRYYRPDDYYYMKLSHLELQSTRWEYQEIVWRIKREIEEIEYQEKNKWRDNFEVWVYSVNEYSYNMTIEISFWIYRQTKNHFKVDTRYWITTYNQPEICIKNI